MKKNSPVPVENRVTVVRDAVGDELLTHSHVLSVVFGGASFGRDKADRSVKPMAHLSPVPMAAACVEFTRVHLQTVGPEVTAERCALLFLSWEIPGSDFGPKTGHRARDLPWFPSVFSN
jgi:hypothetical protein